MGWRLVGLLSTVLLFVLGAFLESTKQIGKAYGNACILRMAVLTDLTEIRDLGGRRAWNFQGYMADAAQWHYASVWLLKARLGYNYCLALSMEGVFDARHLLGHDVTKEETFCRDVMGYSWQNPKQTGNAVYPMQYAGAREMKQWIKSCKKVYPDISSEENRLLEPFRQAGGIPDSILFPPFDEHENAKRAARRDGVEYEGSKKITKEELVDLVRKSIKASAWDGFVHEPPEGIIEYLSMIDLRHPNQIEPTWEAVGESTRKGRITTFDARKLIPQEFWNISFAEMLRWEGEAADRIPIFGDGKRPRSFKNFVEDRLHWVLPNAVKAPVTIADEGLTAVEGQAPIPLETLYKIYAPPQVEAMGQAGYIHTRRLPEFHKKLPVIETPMGIGEDVLRAQSMLWLGSTPGGFHYDEEANVYLQLAGETLAFLVPQNYTDYMTGSVRHPWGSAGLPTREMIAKDPEFKNVPIYLAHLKPGDGITLQGRAYHRFVAQTHDRVSLNWFFVPKWRKMEYNEADWYTREAKSSLTRLAVRQLWARTLTDMFETTGMGAIYMGTKLEYL